MDERINLSHLNRDNSSSSESYTSPKSAPRPTVPERDRATHAQHLLGQFSQLKEEVESQRSSEREIVGVPAPEGRYIEFESFVGDELTIKSLENKKKGIELLSVRKENERTKATVFVPDSEIDFFLNRFREYESSNTRTGKPKNRPLVDSIENLRLGFVRSLWTDSPEEFPEPNEEFWWEVWIRPSDNSISKLRNFADVRDINLSQRILRFTDRIVMLMHTSSAVLGESIEALDFIAELRKAKVTAADFRSLTPLEEQDWTESLADLLEEPSEESPRICILDTGINNSHPLLLPFLKEDSRYACNPDWGVHDHEGHGTKMAGLSLFGDLTFLLQTTDYVSVNALLESVKIIPSTNDTDPDLYGELTKQAVARVELRGRNKPRIFCMAVTANDFRDKGQPSSWSSAIDVICSGAEDGKKRLFILSAGNVRDGQEGYPEINTLEQVYDPGQSWNALTIGAFTQMDILSEPEFEGWEPLAKVGDLGPSSTTSLTWEDRWPFKPDVLFEGGNMAISPDRERVDFTDSLSLLTTSKNHQFRYFDLIGETSGAAALAAKLCSQIMKEYPNYWPETIRGLIVHSADWTPKMKEWMSDDNKKEKKKLLKVFGYGVVNESRAMKSAKNDLTIVHQDSLKPFVKDKMNVLNFHKLPWPKEVLQDLGEMEVKMKVTLSYFIEPNPGRRGWTHKYRYQSFGLRFEVKNSTESEEMFKKRINKKNWDENNRPEGGSDSSKWYLGQMCQNRGSIHSDTWIGTASELAEADCVAVAPVVGWWREKHSEGHDEKEARYSLIISLSCEETDVDLYAEIESEINIKTAIEIL